MRPKTTRFRADCRGIGLLQDRNPAPSLRNELAMDALAPWTSIRFRPFQVFMEKIKCAFSVDRVRADKPFYFATIANLKFCVIEIEHFGKLIANCFVRCDTVEVAAFHHERARSDQCRHLRIVKGAAQIKFEYLI